MRHAHTWAQRFWYRLEHEHRQALWSWECQGNLDDLEKVVILCNIRERCVEARSLKPYLEVVQHIGHSPKMMTWYRSGRRV